MAFNIRKLFGKDKNDEYIEIDLNAAEVKEEKIIVKPFTLRQYDDVNPILNSLREGFIIAIVDIKPLKTKDVLELKRAVQKIKKTVEAIEGSIGMFGESTLIATPSFAEIHKPEPPKQTKADFISDFQK